MRVLGVREGVAVEEGKKVWERGERVVLFWMARVRKDFLFSWEGTGVCGCKCGCDCGDGARGG